MSKRTYFSALGELPVEKRRHLDNDSHSRLLQTPNFDHSLYDELILTIFSHLTWLDLCVTQSTSKNWARLAADNELWKYLYLQAFGRTRLRGSRGFIARLDGREVKPLPGRAKSDDYKDWKWMFRISSNWRKGRCAVEDTGKFLSDMQLTPENAPALDHGPSVHVVLAGALTIIALSQFHEHPPICITDQRHQQHIIVCEPAQPLAARITTIALDQSPPSSGRLSLAAFLSSGDFSVFEFNATNPSSFTKKCTYTPIRRSARSFNVTHAAFYHPLIVTLTDAFSLSVYDISSSNVRHSQTLSTFTSYPPASLILSSPFPSQFKLIVAYATPVYPKHWSVGATELMISRGNDINSGEPLAHAGLSSGSHTFKEDFRHPLLSTMVVTASRTIRAFDVPNGWVNTNVLRAMREQWSRKVLNVVATQTDGKWVVLGPGDIPPSYGRPLWMTQSLPSSGMHTSTGLQLYRLVLPAQSNSISVSPPKLSFIRTLHGHTSAVSALAVADGRCVSLGENGSIWVWDLEAGNGAEVSSADDISTDPGMLRSINGAIAFDERRIVSAYAGRIVVRRFDI